MIKIKKLFAKDFFSCYNLLQENNKDLRYFKQLGWGLKQFNIQFLKEINFGIGIYYKDILEGFIFGDLITIEKNLEYEILVLYVNTKKRNLGYATKLLKNIPLQLNSKKLKKIHLEVAKNNIKEIYNIVGLKKYT